MCHAQCTDSTRTWQQPWPEHKPEWGPTSFATGSGMTWSPWTCGLQPQCQEPQDGLFFWVPPVLGVFVPFCDELSPTPPHPDSPLLCAHHCGITANWHLPNKGRPSTTTSSLRPSAALGSARSKSRTMMLVVTLPPASLQTLAVPLSSANPLRPNTLVRTMLGGGQTCRFGGHTSMCATIEAKGVFFFF